MCLSESAYQKPGFSSLYCVTCGLKFDSCIVAMDSSSTWAQGHQQNNRRVLLECMKKILRDNTLVPFFSILSLILINIFFLTGNLVTLSNLTLPSGQWRSEGRRVARKPGALPVAIGQNQIEHYFLVSHIISLLTALKITKFCVDDGLCRSLKSHKCYNFSLCSLYNLSVFYCGGSSVASLISLQLLM